MNKILLLFFFGAASVCSSQVIFEEAFESTTIPVEWEVITNATDGGWQVGSSNELSSDNFQIESNGTTLVGSNDDICNCDKNNEALITRAIDLSNFPDAVLSFDLFYGNQSYNGATESAMVQISTDKINWTTLEVLHGHLSWDKHMIDISDFGGSDEVYISFIYNDNGGWLYGIAIDNVEVKVPLSLDAALVALDEKVFGEVGKESIIGGTILNNGINEINSIELSYQINGGAEVVEIIDNLDVMPFAFANINFTEAWIPDSEGESTIDVQILSVNGETDELEENNALSYSTEILGEVIVPNKIVDIINSQPEITQLAGSAEGLDRPTDLDFFPVLGKDELWVINQRVASSGGSTVTVSDATNEQPSNFDRRVDGNAWHFMSLPTALSFSDDNFNFASSTGVQDANHDGGTFTGPTLWSSDPDIYAQPSGGNGSHLDMLHGSPFCMGITHEVDNVFWVFDAWNNDIVRYDFVADHGPGNDDHSDGELYRYQNIGIDVDGDIPCHLILDKESGWLYFVDNGNDRVMRLDINSGNVGTSLELINEPLAVHVDMANFTTEVIISEGLDRPSGIELFEGLLLVGDYANGDINVYDTNSGFTQIGTISTGEEGLIGINVGPDGNIYGVNRLNNSLLRIGVGEMLSNTDDLNIAENLKIFPNPTNQQISVSLNDAKLEGTETYEIYNSLGQQVLNGTLSTPQIDVTLFNPGTYVIRVKQGANLHKTEFTVIR